MTVARRLRNAIISGELADGTLLPSEKELSAQLDVGRSTIREALRILQAQGLVTGGNSVSTRGPTVNGSGTLPSAASALENVLLLGQLSLEELLTVRLLIEDAALRAASSHHNSDSLSRAESSLDKMRAHDDDPERFSQADIAFHVALVEASGNRAFSFVTKVLRVALAAHLDEVLKQKPQTRQVLRKLIKEHESILQAVRSGHGRKAALLIQTHINDFYEVSIHT